jgi:hypothetical protein
MKNFNLFFKKSFVSFLGLTILLASFPVSVLAQSDGSEIEINTTNPATRYSIPDTSTSNGSFQNIQYTGSTDQNSGTGFSSINNTSAGSLNYNPGATTGTSKTSSITSKKLNGEILPTQTSGSGDSKESKAAADALGCAVGDILAGGITGLATKGIDTLFSTMTKKDVPVDPTVNTKKEVGMLVVWDVPILPGWDAIAYCLANAVIAYVADSTTAWIQSGFKGKPAFVDDPTKLFQDLADYQMENFISTLQDGLLCDSFSSQVTNALVSDYTSDYQSSGKCTLGAIEGGLTDTVNMGAFFTYEKFFAVSQNPNNNAAGAYLKASSEARNQIAARQESVKTEIAQNNGFLSWREADGPNEGKIITPGIVVQAQLENTLNLAPGRLVLAEKFDQVISSLVNYLIKTALTETLGTVRSSTN